MSVEQLYRYFGKTTLPDPNLFSIDKKEKEGGNAQRSELEDIEIPYDNVNLGVIIGSNGAVKNASTVDHALSSLFDNSEVSLPLKPKRKAVASKQPKQRRARTPTNKISMRGSGEPQISIEDFMTGTCPQDEQEALIGGEAKKGADIVDFTLGDAMDNVADTAEDDYNLNDFLL
jgi:hypothetical protein